VRARAYAVSHAPTGFAGIFKIQLKKSETTRLNSTACTFGHVPAPDGGAAPRYAQSAHSMASSHSQTGGTKNVPHGAGKALTAANNAADVHRRGFAVWRS
jgi:hypothetical protein